MIRFYENTNLFLSQMFEERTLEERTAIVSWKQDDKTYEELLSAVPSKTRKTAEDQYQATRAPFNCLTKVSLNDDGRPGRFYAPRFV